MIMGARRINKFWFFVKFSLLLLFIFLCFWVVFEKDIFMEEFCDCTTCNIQTTVKKNSLWEDLFSEFCVCPSCD